MKKAKQCLTALLPGVLLAITVLSGCGQSQKAVSKMTITLPCICGKIV